MTRFDTTSLRQMRREANITQQELADKMDLCRETVCGIEKRRKNCMNGLRVSTLINWYGHCKDGSSAETKEQYKQALLDAFMGDEA